jgi:hypothetical protein
MPASLAGVPELLNCAPRQACMQRTARRRVPRSQCMAGSGPENCGLCWLGLHSRAYRVGLFPLQAPPPRGRRGARARAAAAGREGAACCCPCS